MGSVACPDAARFESLPDAPRSLRQSSRRYVEELVAGLVRVLASALGVTDVRRGTVERRLEFVACDPGLQVDVPTAST